MPGPIDMLILGSVKVRFMRFTMLRAKKAMPTDVPRAFKTHAAPGGPFLKYMVGTPRRLLLLLWVTDRKVLE